MNKQEIEKSLKRYLKKRISYTFSLLIAFLITGGFATASELNQEVLLSRIKEDREKLEKMLQENYKKEAALQKENLDILKEADFYVKPLNGTLFSMPYFSKKSKNVEKEWQGTVRTPTEHDGMREKFNSLQKGENDLPEAGKYASNQDNLSSGWINKNTKYGKKANSYDVEAKLFILPVVKAPVVKSPTAPAVSFTAPVAPTELKIDAPTAINISMGTISVNAPTITAPTVNIPAAITAPTVATVTVNEPNVAINIGSINVAGPQGLTLPELTAPTVNVNTTVLTPEGIKPPELSVTPPDSPEAPNFTVYTRARGLWLVGATAKTYNDGFNNFDRRIRRFIGINNSNASINDGPFFSLPGIISGINKSQSQVIATTDWVNDGSTYGLFNITNKYTNIKSDQATSNADPWDGWYGPTTPTVSPTKFPGVPANTLKSYTDDGSLGSPEVTGDFQNDYRNKRQQNWIFQGAPVLVKDMTITVGGNAYGRGKQFIDHNGNPMTYIDSNGKMQPLTYAPNLGTAVFAQTNGVRMQNVDINLKGHAIIADVDTQGNYEVNFNQVNVDIKNDFNTILALSSVTINQHVYHTSSDARTSTV